MAKKKRKMSPAHLKALRAAHAKRRGKPRGLYKTGKKRGRPAKPFTPFILPEYKLPNPDIALRMQCYINSFDKALSSVNELFNYVKNGELPKPPPNKQSSPSLIFGDKQATAKDTF